MLVLSKASSPTNEEAQQVETQQPSPAALFSGVGEGSGFPLLSTLAPASGGACSLTLAQEMMKLSVNRSRDYYPHHTLLSAAYMNLEFAETDKSGSHYTQMTAILFSGLAVEALANSFGERYVKNWNDYETSRPIAKIQIVCEVMGTSFDEEKQPWCHLRWLIRFRNRLVHAKPEMVRIEKKMNRDEWDRERMSVPNSKLEKEITLANAKRAVDAAYLIRDLLCEQITEGDLNNLRVDGWSSNVSVIPPKG